MLQTLRISNLALLDSVTLEVDRGFTAVTGETGAGKSVLLGALSLLSGARSDKAMIRQGADALEVEAALFFADSTAIDPRLEELGLPACEEGVLILKRSVHREKMARIQVNGAMATLQQLRSLGEAWIDFHGPGEPQKLFQEKRQLEMLDAYAGNSKALSGYRSDYEAWRALRGEIEALRNGEQLDADEVEFIEKQIARIDTLELSEESVEELERDHARMSRAQELAELAQACGEGLRGEGGLSDRFSELLARFEQLGELDAASAELVERARSLSIELADLGDEVGRLAGDFDFDAEAVAAVEERMQAWQTIRRKHGGTVAAVLEHRDALAAKLAMQGDVEGALSAKLEEAERIEAKLRKAAKALKKARAKASKDLGDRAAELLKALGFKKAALSIEVFDEPALTAHGDSGCRFLFAPNAGQESLPLNKIASSGETARVMLALKTVLAEADATPLLVFDEVDANVGGEVGGAVGTELARLAGAHQVFCVTHLPQVAALASQHFLVTKTQGDDSTTVEIGPIHGERDQRLDELARMLGDRSSDSARAHAEALLGGAS